MERWIALDLETTGLSPTRNEIRELAVVPFGIGSAVGIGSAGPLPCGSFRTAKSGGLHEGSHGEYVLRFDPADFHPSPRPATRSRLVELLRAIGEDAVLIAHNAAFDLAFLAEAFRRARVSPFVLRAYCTLRLARVLLPGLRRYDLAALREALHLEGGQAHVALADARAVAALFKVLAERAGFAREEAIRALHGPPVRVGTTCAGSEVARLPSRPIP